MVPEISDDEMRELQAKDENLGAIIAWLETNHSASSETLKAHSLETRKLWAQVPTVHLLDGILVRKPSDDDSIIQLVVPNAIRKRLFETTHTGPLAAHLGSVSE